MATMYTPAAITTEVRTLIDEPSALTITDAEIQIWLDQAARLTSAVALCVPTTEAVTTTTDTFSYALTTKFVKVSSVMYNDLTPLERLDVRNFGHGAPGGAAADTNRAPSYYYVHADRLYLWPVPKGTSVGASIIDVYGWRTAFAYENDTGSTPKQYEVPDVLQPVLIDYIVGCARVKKQQHNLAGICFQRFLSNLNVYRKDYTDKSLITDSKDMFQIPDRTIIAGQQ